MVQLSTSEMFMESKMKGVFRNTTNNTSRMAPGLAEKIMCKCVKKKKKRMMCTVYPIVLQVIPLLLLIALKILSHASTSGGIYHDYLR